MIRRIGAFPMDSNMPMMRSASLTAGIADRAQHVGTVIRPALAQDRVVICDRFADSTVVYQGYGRGLEPSLLRQLNDTAVQGLWPDATVLLDLAPEQGLRRALTRNMRENKARTEGRFEAESLAFHTRVREGYLTWAALNRERFLVVDADRTPEQVFAAILCGLEEKGLV